MQIARLLKQTWLEWYQSRAFELGAALAFYAVFSIAPVMVLAFTAARDARNAPMRSPRYRRYAVLTAYTL